MPKKNLTTDEETEHLLQTHNVNASEEFRKHIKQKYGSINVMEQRRNEIESRLDTLLIQKQEIEREMRELEKNKDQLDNLLVKNEVMQRIKTRPSWRVKVEEKIGVIKQAKQEGDSREEIEMYIERNAEILSDQLPFEKSELVEILEQSVMRTYVSGVCSQNSGVGKG